MSGGDDPRLEAMIEVILACARHDFSRRAPVSGTDSIDALATGLNMLAEELESTVARRDDLDEANARLVEMGRMAAVGMLAAGVAHEVNNPAAWVTLALGMIRRSHASMRAHLRAEGELDRAAALAELDTLDGLLRDCTEGMGRITAVVGDLRTLSRADPTSYHPIEFGEVIASCCRLASHVLDGVELSVHVDEGPMLIANRGRVAQVVTNLVVNAAQAVRDVPVRRIAIAVGPHDAGTLLSVDDSGPGIPQELTPRIFEPFFSTKARDGTGLGLTIVSQIASSYGGWVRANASRRHGGARVEVWFPSSEHMV